MRVVFMGTPEFAVPSLEALAAERDVVAVYTRPDAVSGRGGSLRPSPVKQCATRLGIAVHEVADLRDPRAVDELRSLAPDVVVVAAFGVILPPDVLAIPPLGCLNVHASLLPRWRGAAPVQRALLAGDEMTGVMIMRMEEGLDTGPTCVSREVAVGDMNAAQLTEELARAGADILLAALARIEQGACDWIAQDDAQATYAAKITKPEVALSPTQSADEIVRRVRASSPAAPARAVLAGRRVTVLSAHGAAEVDDPGEMVVSVDGVRLGSAAGSVLVSRLKPDGKGAMDALAWARGLRDATLKWGADQ